MKFVIYDDKAGHQRWKLVAKNGKIVADSGEGYNSVGNARRAIKTFRREMDQAEIVVAPKATGEDS